MKIASMDFVGYVAATLTTAAFLPQLFRVWRRKSADDISIAMYSLLIVGVLMWIAYGVSIAAWPVVAANFATVVQAAAILWLKLLYTRN